MWMSVEGRRRDVCMSLCLHKGRDTFLSLLRNEGLKRSVFEQPDLVKDAPVGYVFQLDWMIFKGPVYPKPFYGTMKYIARDIVVEIQGQTWKSFGMQQWEFIMILCQGDCSSGDVLVLPGENGKMAS